MSDALFLILLVRVKPDLQAYTGLTRFCIFILGYFLCLVDLGELVLLAAFASIALLLEITCCSI